MTTLILAIVAAVLFILLLVRSSLNAVSTMALKRIAEDADDPSPSIHAYLERRLIYRITIQFSTLLFSAGAVFCLIHYVKSTGRPGLGLTAVLSAFLGLFVLSILAQVIAALHPERILRATLPVIAILVLLLGFVTFPLAALMEKMIQAHRRRMEALEDDKDRDEDIAALLHVGQEEGILEGEDSVLIQGVMEFGDTVAREVMTPRTDMVSAEVGLPLKQVAETLAEARHTRIPLYEGQIDNIVGVAYLKDFLAALHAGEGERPVREFARPVHFVPENKSISSLLREFQSKRVQLAIVVDEYGGVDGLVTTEDLLEEIVGEIQESDEVEQDPFVEIEPGVVEALGRAPVDDLEDFLDVDIPEGDYDSIAGWVSTALGRIPTKGQQFDLSGLGVEILSADRKRIHRVRITVLGDDEEQQKNGG
jgi:putative hemolysin